MLNFRTLHDANYHDLRRVHSLIKSGYLCREKRLCAIQGNPREHGEDDRWKNFVRFRKHTAALVYNRDYSLKVVDGQFVAVLQSLNGRIKNIPVEGLELLHDENPSYRHGQTMNSSRQMLHVPVTREVPAASVDDVRNIVGIDGYSSPSGVP